MNKNISELCGIFFFGSWVNQIYVCNIFTEKSPCRRTERKLGKGGRSNRTPSVDRVETTSQGSNRLNLTTSPLNLSLLSVNWFNHREGGDGR